MAEISTVGIGFDLDAGPAVATVQQLGAASEKSAAQADKLEASTRRIGASADGLTASQRELQRRMQEVLAVGRLLDQHNAAAVSEYQRQINAIRDLAAQTKQLGMIRAQLDEAGALAATSTDKVTEAITRGSAAHDVHFAGLGRIRQGLTSLVAQMTGTPPVLDRISSSLGGLALGTGLVTGIMAGLAAIAAAYQFITASAREAAEQQERTMKDFDRIAHLDVRGQGEAAQNLYSGDPHATNATDQASMAELRRLAAVQQAIKDAGTTTGFDRFGEAMAKTTPEARAASVEYKRLNDEIERRRKLLDSITGPGGTLTRAGTEQAAADRPGFITDALRAQQQAEQQAQRERDRIAAEQQKQSDQFYNDQNKEKLAGLANVAAINVQIDARQRLLVAAREGPAAERAVSDALEIEAAHRQFLIDTAKLEVDARDRLWESTQRGLVTSQQTAHAIEDEAAARKTQAEAVKHAADEQRRQVEEMDRLLKSSFSTFFSDILQHGKSAFQSLWDTIKAGFIKLIADMAAARLTEKMAGIVGGSVLGLLTPNLAGAQMMGNGAGQGGIADASVSIPGMGGSRALGYGAAALGGLAAGYGAGSSLYSSSRDMGANYAVGALGGAASGALTGAMAGAALGPIGAAAGAALGGITGLVGGLFGMGSAAKAAAKAMAEAQATLKLTMDALHARATGDTLAQQIAAENANRETLRKQIEDTFPGGGSGSEQVRKRNAALLDMNATEDRIIAGLREAAQLQKQAASDDLAVRTLRNQGQALQADILAKQTADAREYADAVKAGLDASYLAQLQWNQGVEEAAVAAGKAADAMKSLSAGLNIVEGYRDMLTARTFDQMMPPGTGFGYDTPFGGGASTYPSYPSAPVAPPPMRPGSGGATPETVTMQPFVIQLDSDVVAQGVKRVYKADAQRQFGDSTLWGETA